MVDSSDTERIGTSAEEFHAILDEEELRDALILVYANKQVITPVCPLSGQSRDCKSHQMSSMNYFGLLHMS